MKTKNIICELFASIVLWCFYRVCLLQMTLMIWTYRCSATQVPRLGLQAYPRGTTQSPCSDLYFLSSFKFSNHLESLTFHDGLLCSLWGSFGTLLLLLCNSPSLSPGLNLLFGLPSPLGRGGTSIFMHGGCCELASRLLCFLWPQFNCSHPSQDSKDNEFACRCDSQAGISLRCSPHCSHIFFALIFFRLLDFTCTIARPAHWLLS